MIRTERILFLLSLIAFLFPCTIQANDWPMWRYDAGRTACSPQQLPERLHLQWVREYPRLEPTWDDPLNQDLMQFDSVYEPIVLGKMMFVGSNAFDRIVALDTDTGAEKWSFHTEGPVRLPPVAGDGKVYFVSDDGALYCLNADTGESIWKYNGVPRQRLILGNQRLISTWCARGGPVLKDGVVYFGAGIWPFMGVFIFALDAQTGKEIWVNDGSGAIYIKQPHNSPSFAGIAPQGSMVISGDRLLVPGGRSVPACFDRHTGEFLYYRLAESQKTGGAFVCATDDHFFNYYRDRIVSLYDLDSGAALLPRIGGMPVLSGKTVYCSGETTNALDYSSLRQIVKESLVKDSKTKEIKIKQTKVWTVGAPLWEIDIDSSGDMIRAGNRLYAGGNRRISTLNLNEDASQTPTVSWQTSVDGTVSRLIAADDRLFAVTLEGKIYCFGESDPKEIKKHPFVVRTNPIADDIQERAASILNTSQIDDGYCYLFGVGDGDLAEALVRQSQLHVIAFESDPAKVDALRRRFVDAGLYGERLSVITADAQSVNIPPYLASLIVFEDATAPFAKNREFLEKLYDATRPYGGTICLKGSVRETQDVAAVFNNGQYPNAKIFQTGEYVHVVREGSLPGADDWTHQYGDIANTVKSDDRLVKLPLGILWFGGSSNLDVLPRHGHGPPEQIVNGRLFIQGMDCLSARDVYSGRVLWKRTFSNLGNYGVYYNETYKDTPLSTQYNQVHIPGANARGTNYVVADDRVYIVEENRCQILDPETGETQGVFELPALSNSDEKERWGYIGVYEDYLIAGAGFVNYVDFLKLDDSIEDEDDPFINYDISSSKRLVVMNRRSGDVLWTYDSSLGLRHNAIAVGEGRLYCIDRMPDVVEGALKRRGKRFLGTPRVMAFDLSNGDILWSKSQDVFGTWLSYSKERDVLVEAVRSSRDMLDGEPKEKMAAYRGSDGERLWHVGSTYGGPCIIHGDRIITEPYAYSLLTGERIMRRNPLTGEESPWKYSRQYGCNYAIASEFMMTFRSAAAGFFDLEQDAGTGNFGGFKSGCTSNLIAADGVLNAPDYTRTCSCSYQNQTSLAMIHDPSVEMWTYNDVSLGEGPIRQLGVNLSAPGDRRDDGGVLWLEYPIVGGPSPKIQVETDPTEPIAFRNHTARMRGGEMEWIAASGMKGLHSISITLATPPIEPEEYTVRLFFAEPDQLEAGERMFDVFIQGDKALVSFDVVREAGSIRKGIVKEFRNVKVSHKLKIDLTPCAASKIRETILCGVEIVSNDLQ